MITVQHIEFLAQVHKQVAEQVDLTKPLPQEIEIKIKVNLTVDKPGRAFMFLFDGGE